jgi:hypothetical protein
VLAADGPFHRGKVLVADALCALTRTVCGRRPVAPPGVTFPAHWRPAAVEGLRRELAKRPEWTGPKSPTLVSDAAAALTALQAEPGLPTRGVVALCDFGGTGTSITHPGRRRQRLSTDRSNGAPHRLLRRASSTVP